jgi:peptidoglycan/LPS O-acetylase OafA/YrhL
MGEARAAGAKNREIEALRAIAIVLTLCQHVPLLFPSPQVPAWLLWIYEHVAFWTGVDLFFVVSGFVVTASLLRGFRDTEARGASRWSEVRRFWVRRAFRLFPLAWLWVTLVLVATVWFNRSGIFGTLEANLEQAMWIFLYVYNWFVQPLFAAGMNIAPLAVYWSLAIEEQFYLLLPLLMLGLRVRVLVVLLVAVIALQFFVWRPAPLFEPWSTLRCEGLAWGVLLALFAHTPRYAAAFPARIAAPTAAWLANVFLLLAIVILPWAFFNLAVTTALVALCCLLWVWLASFERGLVFPGLAESRIAQWLAARSYALYVVHIPAYMAVKEIAHRLDLQRDILLFPLIAVGVLVACLLAEVSYRQVEAPLRESGRRIAGRMA